MDNDRYQPVSQDILAKLFFDQFVYHGFSKLLFHPEQIDYFKAFETVKTDPINFSSYVFKMVAFFDAKSMPKEAIVLLNNLLESYCNQQLLDRGYVIIKFVFWLANKHSFNQINEGYYQQLMDQILETMPGAQNQLENAAAITVAKYEQILVLVTFFLAKVSIPENHMKLLRKTFDTAYQFPDERFRKLDGFTLGCLMFDNPDLYEYPAMAERRLGNMHLLKMTRPILRGWKSDLDLRRAFPTINNRYFVLKFNFKSNSHKFRYLIVRPDRIAVLAKQKVAQINNFKQKGVCWLKRFRGQHPRGGLRPRRKKGFGLQASQPQPVQRIPDPEHLR